LSGLPLNSNNETGIISFDVPTPFPIGPVNLYVLLGDKITLVDTGPKTEMAWKMLIYQLNKNGIRMKDIDQVVLTHHHVDHSGLSSVMMQYHPKLKMFAHEKSIPWIERREESLQQKRRFFKQLYEENGLSDEQIEKIQRYQTYLDQFIDPVKVDGALAEGDAIEGLPGWKVLYTPGHAQGHISLYHSESQTLIAGDHLIEHTSPGAFVEPATSENEPRPRSFVDYQESLERMKEMNIRQVLSGHGKVIYQPKEMMTKQLDRLTEQAEKVRKHLQEGPLQVYDLMKLLYPQRYKKHLPLFFSEVIGSLDLLEKQGKVEAYQENGRIKYQFI